MSKFVRVPNGDYTLEVQDSGIITLNTGNGTGTVFVTGNLTVNGNTTNVSTVDLVIEDNIILLNNGETGSGVTLLESGMRVDRGNFVDVKFVFDERIQWNRNDNTTRLGAFTFRDVNNGIIGIQTTTIDTDGGDLFLINRGNGVISVSGTTDYERQVFSYIQNPPASGNFETTGNLIDDDIIPNSRAMVDYVDFVIGNTFQSGIESGTLTRTYVETFDFENTGLASNIVFGVDDQIVAQMYGDRIELNDLRIRGSSIETLNSDGTLELSAPGTGTVKIRDVLEIANTPTLDDASVEPTVSLDGTRIYVSNQSYGKTGLYYVNKDSVRDELISTNRSLLFSMIF